MSGKDPAAPKPEGAFLAWFAHICAFLLLMVFSAGSLIGVSGQALISFERNPSDIPALISAVLGVVIVFCSDVAMLYAASVLRSLGQRQADWRARIGPWIVIAVVSLIESSAFLYMSYLYDKLNDPFVWALVIVRSLSGPGLSVYLSMATRLPVHPDSIVQQVAVLAGHNVLSKVRQLAADPDQSLQQHVEIFSAAADMTNPARERLQDVLVAVNPAEQVVQADGTVVTVPRRTSRRRKAKRGNIIDLASTKAKIASAIARLGPDATNQQLADAAGVSLSTLRRFKPQVAEQRQESEG